MQVWELGPGRLMVAGGFSDLALHHHPAVQVTVGGRGPLTVTCDGENEDVGRLAAEHLLSAIDGEPTHGVSTVPCRLVVRGSA